MVRVKICGLTQPTDVAAACAAGADALGFVFYAPSPRAVSPEQARALLQAVAPFTSCVTGSCSYSFPIQSNHAKRSCAEIVF